MKNLALILTFCFCLACVTSVHAYVDDDDVKIAKELYKKCREASRRCSQATASCKTDLEFDEAIDTCDKATNICGRGTKEIGEKLISELGDNDDFSKEARKTLDRIDYLL
jgi:hypothetical protein